MKGSDKALVADTVEAPSPFLERVGVEAPSGLVTAEGSRELRDKIRAGGLSLSWEAQAMRRLSYIAGLGVVLGSVMTVMNFFRQANVGARAGADRPAFLLPMLAVGSLLVFLVSKWDRVKPQLRLDVGLGFLVLAVFITSYFRHALPYVSGDVLRGFPPMTLFVMVAAVMVPVSPMRMFIAASLCGLADALSLYLTMKLGGNPSPPGNLWLWLMAPNAIAVILAVLTSQVMHRIGQTVTQARALGRYRLVKKLGEGGMGEVWKAQHLMLRRAAAIKLIHPHTLGRSNEELERSISRFEREVQATSALRCPNTIEVFDYGVADDGTFYYVMELLDGMDLSTLVEHHGPMSPERAVYLLLQACRSLEEAHSVGLVHRDIKPANIYVCRMGLDLDVVKVLDFGLVKQVNEEETQLTGAGSIVGTPGFIAPEMVQSKEVTASADIYALGCVAFFMLTGRLVFEADSALLQFMAHAREAPQPPSKFTPAPIPPELDALILRCLEKEPSARPLNIAELERAFESLDLAQSWDRARAEAWWAAL